jgi:hypothetical protein
MPIGLDKFCSDHVVQAPYSPTYVHLDILETSGSTQDFMLVNSDNNLETFPRTRTEVITNQTTPLTGTI